MTLSAFVDESEPHTCASYLLSCAFVAVEDHDFTREMMLAARTAGERKVHWHDRLPRQHAAPVSLAASLPATHVLIVRDDKLAESAERRRRKCPERLLWLRDQREDVYHVVLEARQRKQNLGDRRILDVLRASKVIGTRLRMGHIAGPAEPLLWLPAIVAGAYTARLSGNDTIFKPLADVVEVATANV